MSKHYFTGITRVTPAFITGMLLAMYFRLDLFYLFLLLLVNAIAIIGFKYFIPSKLQYSFRWLNGIFIQFAMVLCVFFITCSKQEILFSTHVSKVYGIDAVKGIVNEAPVVKGKNIRFELEINAVRTNAGWREASGRCLTYIRKDSLISILRYGDVLLFLKDLLPVSGPMNPGQFNFQAWLGNRQIYHQVFLKPDEFLILENGKGHLLMELAIVWREKLLAAFSKAGISGQEEAVLSALILGQDDEIDAELLKSYSMAGVLHVLAVSGMHVGLIYGAIRTLIDFPGRRRKLRWFKAVMLITCLWLYAMLTGLSPSVLRAAMMLSFIVAGLALDRSVNPLNVLSASALSLFLLFSPALLFSAGFQLSYLAVAGIMFLYKPLFSIYSPQTWLGSQVWSILSVSVVAQVATFPLSLYYFHSFPNYFLLANLVVIPLSTFVIFGGIFLLFLSWWSDLALILGKLLSWLIRFLNDSVITLGEFPGSTSQGLYVDAAGMCLLYLSIVFLCLFLLWCRPKYLLLCISALLIFHALYLFEKSLAIGRNGFMLYHVPKHSYMQFIQGRSTISITDSLLSEDQPSRKKVSENFMLGRQLRAEVVYDLSTEVSRPVVQGMLLMNFPFLQFVNDRFYILTEKSKNRIPVSGEIDYVLLVGNPRVNIRKWLENLKCKAIIADASNSSRMLDKWKEECKKKGIQFIDVTKSGAFYQDYY